MTGWHSLWPMGQERGGAGVGGWGGRDPVTHTVILQPPGSVLGLLPRTTSDDPPNSPVSVREFCVYYDPT